jgi:alpha-tubulin suppressor-like RCC1 family protein
MNIGKIFRLLSICTFFCGFSSIVNAQINDTNAAAEQAVLEAIEETTPVAASNVPASGTFYSAQHSPLSASPWPPLPGNINNLASWDLGDGNWLLDDTNFDYSAARLEAGGMMMAAGVPFPGSGGSSGGGGSGSGFPVPDYGTNLWLEVTNASNGQVNGWIHNSIPIVPHAILSRQKLLDAAWSPAAVFYGTEFATNTPFFDIPMLDRNTLFLWAQVPFAPRQIAASASDNVAIDRDGTVWAWGDDSSGQIGNGQWDAGSYLPQQAIGLSNIVAVASVEYSDSLLALDSSGIVWSWGYNKSGQLGRNGDFAENISAPIPNLSNIVAIAMGEFSGTALKSDGTVWAWGDLNTNGSPERDLATRLHGVTNAIAIASGRSQRFALCADGSVWGWGDNFQGQIGVTNESDLIAPVQVTSLTNAVALSGGYNHSLALLSDGTVMAFGDNNDGQLGDGTNNSGSSIPISVSALSNIVAIATGFENSLALDKYGRVFVWGFGGDGELGDGTENSTNVPVPVAGLSNVVSIAVGGAADLAMTANGKIYEWGYFSDEDTSSNYLTPFEIDLPALPLDDASNITAYFPSQCINTNVVTAYIVGGAAAGMTYLVNNTNFASAQWAAFGATESINLSTTDGLYQVYFGFQGQNGIAYWSEKSITLDTAPPAVNIATPANNSSFNLSSINVQGNFVEANFKQLSLNSVQAFISGTNFVALNVPLNPGTNIITAIAQDLAGNFGSNSIVAIGLTNADGGMNTPVQLQATPIAGFVPLAVTFQITSNAAPGSLLQVSYDFNGDGIGDFVTNNLNPVTYAYPTNGEYFPVATIQTTAGAFSSSGGWNSTDPNRLQVTVQLPISQIASFSVTDPVDIKWVAPTNLYVLSGRTATLMEMDTNGNVVRSISGLGTNPSGFDVDANGNVYVAITSSNEVWKFGPTTTAFKADTNFGFGGFIGLTNGLTGTNNGAFNAPFDVAVSPDNGQISVSDSGNNRIQQFSTINGAFITAFGTNGPDVGEFNNPKGLAYDSIGSLYIVDSGNSRIVVDQYSQMLVASGTNGAALGQFSSPLNISVNKRGVYVSDTGNNRIQAFNPPAADNAFTIDSSSIRFAVFTNLNQPYSVAAVENLTNEIFYVADTADNRVVLYACPPPDPISIWKMMTNSVMSGDIPGAMTHFSVVTKNDYQQAILSLGTGAISDIGQIGTLTPVYIKNDKAEYYFEQTVNGQLLLFPVEFVKENGVWKILEF